MPCSAANTPEQFVADQRADERHPLGTLRHPTLGTRDVPGPPLRVEGPFHERDLVAREPGADTDDVLGVELGHTAAERPALAGGRPCLTMSAHRSTVRCASCASSRSARSSPATRPR